MLGEASSSGRKKYLKYFNFSENYLGEELEAGINKACNL